MNNKPCQKPRVCTFGAHTRSDNEFWNSLVDKGHTEEPYRSDVLKNKHLRRSLEPSYLKAHIYGRIKYELTFVRNCEKRQ